MRRGLHGTQRLCVTVWDWGGAVVWGGGTMRRSMLGQGGGVATTGPAHRDQRVTPR